MHIDIFKIIKKFYYYWLHIIQLHEASFHFLINVLKALSFSAVLVLAYVNFQFYLVTLYVKTSIQAGSSHNLSI